MSWNKVKQITNNQSIIDWCEEMGIKNYIINSKGEIDVDGDVDVSYIDFEELPYKFGRVSGFFDVSYNKNLKSLTNCPDYIDTSFDVDYCSKLDSLVGCPKEVKIFNFWCYNCKHEFSEEEVRSLCKVKGDIII